MRERAEGRDPQLQQRRAPLPPGHSHFYATCHPGLEEVVAAELLDGRIGASNVHPGAAGGKLPAARHGTPAGRLQAAPGALLCRRLLPTRAANA